MTCDLTRVADYSKLFSDDLVNVLGLSVTLRSLSRIMSESRHRSEVWELWPPGEVSGTMHLQLTSVTSPCASGLPAPHLSRASLSVAGPALAITEGLLVPAGAPVLLSLQDGGKILSQ